MERDLSRWSPSLAPYADWLAEANEGVAKVWAGHLRSEDDAVSEGAIAEALAWDYLKHRVDQILSADSSDAEPSPDFLCEVDGREFYVEVTNVSRSKVTDLTGLEDELDLTAGPLRRYGGLSGQIKREISSKARQGRGIRDHPFLVMVCTLHRQASALLCTRAHVQTVLHSPTLIQGYIDPDGNAVGEVREVADLKHAAFTESGSSASARRNVAAALIAGLGAYPEAAVVDSHVLGVLHQDAVRPLDPSLLPDIPFCRFKSWPPGEVLEVEWVGRPKPRRLTPEEYLRRLREWR